MHFAHFPSISIAFHILFAFYICATFKLYMCCICVVFISYMYLYWLGPVNWLGLRTGTCTWHTFLLPILSQNNVLGLNKYVCSIHIVFVLNLIIFVYSYCVCVEFVLYLCHIFFLPCYCLSQNTAHFSLTEKSSLLYSVHEKLYWCIYSAHSIFHNANNLTSVFRSGMFADTIVQCDNRGNIFA